MYMEKSLEETDLLRDKAETISREASMLRAAYEKTKAENSAMERNYDNELLAMKLKMEQRERETDEAVKLLQEQIDLLHAQLQEVTPTSSASKEPETKSAPETQIETDLHAIQEPTIEPSTPKKHQEEQQAKTVEEEPQPQPTTAKKKFVLCKKNKTLPAVFTPTKDDSVSIQELALHTSQQQTQTQQKQKKRTHAAILGNKTTSKATSEQMTSSRRQETSPINPDLAKSLRPRTKPRKSRERRLSASFRRIEWETTSLEAQDIDSKYTEDDSGDFVDDDDDFQPDDSDFYNESTDIEKENTTMNGRTRRSNKQTETTKRKAQTRRGRKRPSSSHSPLSSKRIAFVDEDLSDS